MFCSFSVDMGNHYPYNRNQVSILNYLPISLIERIRDIIYMPPVGESVLLEYITKWEGL